jgi:hypothetical protein
MKTDSLFYRLLQAEPTLAFELAGLSVPKPEGYRFISQEVKQTAFRFDGIAEPPAGPTRPGAMSKCSSRPAWNFTRDFSARYCSISANTQAPALGMRWSFTQAAKPNGNPPRPRRF